jgi:hypothetical protein
MTEQTVIKKHHWMVAAQLTFVVPGIKESHEGAVIVQNTILLTDEKEVNFRDLGRAQSALFQNLNDRFNEVVDVKDIVFVNISHIGYMSEPDFKAGLTQKTDKPAKAPVLKSVE